MGYSHTTLDHLFSLPSDYAIIVVLGAKGSGKSSFLKQLIRARAKSVEAVMSMPRPAGGLGDEAADLGYKVEMVVDGISSKLLLVDTKEWKGAVERYHSAHAFVIVYSVASYDSYLKAKRWVRELRNKSGDSPSVISVLGNKADLRHLRGVSVNSARIYARSSFVLFAEGSATTRKILNQSIYLFDNTIRALRSSFIDMSEDPEDLEEAPDATSCSPSSLRDAVCAVM